MPWMALQSATHLSSNKHPANFVAKTEKQINKNIYQFSSILDQKKMFTRSRQQKQITVNNTVLEKNKQFLTLQKDTPASYYVYNQHLEGLPTVELS
jgi:Ni,Fe-hydrogenase III component G